MTLRVWSLVLWVPLSPPYGFPFCIVVDGFRSVDLVVVVRGDSLLIACVPVSLIERVVSSV